MKEETYWRSDDVHKIHPQAFPSEGFVLTRDDLVRLVLAQQWAVACIAWANVRENGRGEWNSVDDMIDAASLPSPADVVDAWLKGTP